MTGATATVETRGVWRAALRGWRVFVPVVLVHAMIQAGLVAPGVLPGLSPVFLVLVAASLIAVIFATAITAAQASAVTRGVRFRLTWQTLAWTAVWIIAIAVFALAHVAVAGLVMVAAGLMLPVVAAGGRARTWFAAVWRAPWRFLTWLLLSYVAIIISGALDFELAFLVSGVLSAALSWTVAGVITVLVLCGSADLARGSRKSRRERTPAALT